VLLMVVSLFGGYRTATRMTEETSSEETSSAQEYAHRQSDGAATRRARADGERWVNAVVTNSTATASRPADRLRGESPPSGHLMANGLCAPLCC